MANYEFKIEKDIPIPPHARYPLAEMEVGDSFVAPPKNARRAEAAASNYGQRYNKKFRTRIQPDGSRRIWRVE